MLLGTLSNDDDDDSAENVAKKLNLCSFKLSQVYMDPLNMSSASDFSWSWILKILFKFKNRKENSSSYVHVLHKTSNQEVSRRSRAVDVKEKSCTKKRDALAELLLWSLNLLFFEVVVVVVFA